MKSQIETHPVRESFPASRVTVSQICADLGIGRVKAYRMLEQQIIPNALVGRTRIVTRPAYEAWKATCGLGLVRAT